VITLTDDQVLSTLRDVVAENPEKVYKAPDNMLVFGDDTSCFYVHKNEDGTEEAGCIVGTVLHRLGVSLADLKRVEGLSAVSALRAAEVKGLSYPTKSLLRYVQHNQDGGSSWGQALTNAVELYEAHHDSPAPVLEAV
jgi:hypothetical protein